MTRHATNNRVLAQNGDGLGDFLKKIARSSVGKQIGQAGKAALGNLAEAGINRASAALARKIQGNGLRLAGGGARGYKKKAVVSKQNRRR